MKDNQNIKFSFGKNWQNFLISLNEDKIQAAENSLKSMLALDSLKGKSFLDAGCGSGLFSLAAIRLGAEKVVSFDFDEESVACTNYLHDTYNAASNWHIKNASVLERQFLESLGKFDIVYSWGVLHHTGHMWNALNNITLPVSTNGILFISIYNDQGIRSKAWKLIKYFYNIFPQPLRTLMAVGLYLTVLTVMVIKGVIRFQSPTGWFTYGEDRGMNIWNDVVDWIGGYPFETATPKQIISFFNDKNFKLINSVEKNGSGCNEFVLLKNSY